MILCEMRFNLQKLNIRKLRINGILKFYAFVSFSDLQFNMRLHGLNFISHVFNLTLSGLNLVRYKLFNESLK